MKDWTRPKPLTVEEWNEQLGITNGKQIAEFLASFGDDFLELKPTLPDLENKVIVAMDGIGMDIRSRQNMAGLGNVEIVSLEKLNDASPSLGIPDFIPISLISPNDLSDYVDERFNGWREELRARGVEKKLADIVWKNFIPHDFLTDKGSGFERFCIIRQGKMTWKYMQILMTAAFTSFLSLLFVKLELLILGKEEESKNLDLLLDLYRNGNLPVGKMKDNETFIVLVK